MAMGGRGSENVILYTNMARMPVIAKSAAAYMHIYHRHDLAGAVSCRNSGSHPPMRQARNNMTF